MFFLFSCGLSPEDSKAYALIVGIADYPLSSMGLAYAASDGRAVSNLLAGEGYETSCLIDGDATYSNIAASMKTIAASMRENDLFLFYYSGHGISLSEAEKIGASFPDSGGYGIILHSGKEETNTNVGAYVASNVLTEQGLGILLGMLPGYSKAVFLDSCYSGGFIDPSTVFDPLPEDYQGKAVEVNFGELISKASEAYFQGFSSDQGLDGCVVVSAAGSEELAWEGFENHGVFSCFFLTAGEHADLDADGCVNTFEMYLYIKAGVETYWNSQYTSAAYTFLPRISGQMVDCIIFQ